MSARLRKAYRDDISKHGLLTRRRNPHEERSRLDDLEKIETASVEYINQVSSALTEEKNAEALAAERTRARRAGLRVA